MRWPRIAPFLPSLGLTAAAILVVMLTLQVRSLREELGAERRNAAVLRTGMFVPAVQGFTLDGAPAALAETPAGERQVLFLYNTRCPYCLQTLPAWKELAGRLAGDTSVQVYGVSVDSADLTLRYAREHALPYPTVLLHPRSLRSLYRADVVPQTVVLDAEGYVLHARAGVLDTTAALDSVIAATR
jgi:peroxiredoxin